MAATRLTSRISICKHTSRVRTLMNESTIVHGKIAPRVFSLPLVFEDIWLPMKATRDSDAKTTHPARKPSASTKPSKDISAQNISNSLPTHADSLIQSPMYLVTLVLMDPPDYEDTKKLHMELLNSSAPIA